MKLRGFFCMLLTAAVLISPAFADAAVVEPMQVSNAPLWLLLAVLVIIAAVVLIAVQQRKKKK